MFKLTAETNKQVNVWFDKIREINEEVDNVESGYPTKMKGRKRGKTSAIPLKKDRRKKHRMMKAIK